MEAIAVRLGTEGVAVTIQRGEASQFLANLSRLRHAILLQ
jgi:hypothetical protein